MRFYLQMNEHLRLQLVFICWSSSLFGSCRTNNTSRHQISELRKTVAEEGVIGGISTNTLLFTSPKNSTYPETSAPHNEQPLPGNKELSTNYQKVKNLSKTDIIIYDKANFSKEYNESVKRDRRIEFVYTYDELWNETKAVRVSTRTNSTQNNFPILFVVRQQEGVISWRVPFFLDFQFEFFGVSRTLCPENITGKQNIFIEVTSMAETSSNFVLMTSFVKDFELTLGKEKSVTVTPTEPIYYMFTFPKDVESVIVTGHSLDTNCLTMSIQDAKCPVYDLDRNIRFHGLFQTMSKEAAIVVQKGIKLSNNAFYVVMVLMPNNLECSSIETVSPEGEVRSKNLTILVKLSTPVKKYSTAILASVGTFLMFYVIAGIALLIYTKCDKGKGFPDLSESERERLLWGAAGLAPSDSDSDERSVLLPCDYSSQRYGSTINQKHSDTVTAPLLAATSPSATTDDTSSVNSSLDTQEIDFLNDAEEEKDVFRTKTALFVSDLSRKGRKKLEKYGKVYNWNLWTIVIFYGLPVIQLVITYQKVLHLTGNEDTCYYNFKCAMPYKVLSSFNNVFSNIGYLLLGILFLLLVWRRDLLHREIVKKYGKSEELYGIPQPYGLFYAMGLGLCMEGVMSACYHVCPTYSNFQFDTSFMYIIACLCMLRLYQTRHPDINAKAHTAYLYMAFIIFIAVIGVVYQTPIFWIVFAVIHFVTTLVLSVQIYYMGRWKIDLGLFNRMRLMLCSDFLQCAKPMYKDRLILLIIGNILNWSFAIYGAIEKPGDFASYLLAIFIGNLLFYLCFYLIMKHRSNETIKYWTVFYIIMTGILWAFALYFFMKHLTSWQLYPAESRDKNQDCILLEFFDDHDIWHFLSATSMFFSFMILLTLDDDLQLIRRDHIPVF